MEISQIKQRREPKLSTLGEPHCIRPEESHRVISAMAQVTYLYVLFVFKVDIIGKHEAICIHMHIYTYIYLGIHELK